MIGLMFQFGMAIVLILNLLIVLNFIINVGWYWLNDQKEDLEHNHVFGVVMKLFGIVFDKEVNGYVSASASNVVEYDIVDLIYGWWWFCAGIFFAPVIIYWLFLIWEIVLGVLIFTGLMFVARMAIRQKKVLSKHVENKEIHNESSD